MLLFKLDCSVAVLAFLEGACLGHVDVVGLVRGELGELGAEGGQVELSDLLVELLWQYVHFALLVLVGSTVLPEVDLGEDLVREGAGHDE